MAFSNWLVTHGTSATVQNPADVQSLGYYGWGLEFVQPAGKYSWVHIAVPTAMSGTFSSAIRIYFKTTGGNVRINQVDVWNGSTRVKSFANLNWSGSHGEAGGIGGNELALDPPVNFEAGLGLSIMVAAGADPDWQAATNKFILCGAGALFTEK